MKVAIAVQRGLTVGAALDDGYSFQLSPVIGSRLGLQGFNDQPLIRIGLLYLRPLHVDLRSKYMPLGWMVNYI